MKSFLTFSEFLNEDGSAFSIRDKKPGDTIVVDGKSLTITKFLTWIKNRESKCMSFMADIEGKSVKVVYDEGRDGYMIREYEGDSTQLATDLFLATQTAANGIAF